MAEHARRHVGEMVLDGVDRKTAAENCGMDRQTLRDWAHRYNAEGVSGLFNRRPPDPPCLLSAAQKEELAEMVRAGPDPETDGVCAGGALIWWRFGVTMHEQGQALSRLYLQLLKKLRRTRRIDIRMKRGWPAGAALTRIWASVDTTPPCPARHPLYLELHFRRRLPGTG